MKQFIAGSDKHLKYLADGILDPDGSMNGWGQEYFEVREIVQHALRNFIQYGSLQEGDLKELRMLEDSLGCYWIVERVRAEGENLLDLLED